MKNNFYLKHQLMARHDSRMELMYDTEGPKGIGVYWMIVEILAMFPDGTATIKDVHRYLKLYKISKSYITKIILDYQLFDLYEDDYISAAELNPSRPTELKPTKFRDEETTLKKEEATVYSVENQKTKRTKEKKTVSKAEENTVSNTKNNTKQCPISDENRSKNDGTNSFFDAKKHENRPKTLEESSFLTLPLAANSLILNDLRKTNAGIKENIRDITTTTEKKEKEKKPAAVVDDDIVAVADGNLLADSDKLNSGNCKNWILLSPSVVAEAPKCNPNCKTGSENTNHRANYDYLATEAFGNPTHCRGKCLSSTRTMPQHSWSNATCHAPPSVAFGVVC